MSKSSIRSLRVQASQSVDVSFNMPGVIAWQNYDHATQRGIAYLGQRVAAVDLETLIYGMLNQPAGGDDGLLKFGTAGIRGQVRSRSMFALRNEALGATLDRMLQQRRGAWRARLKYGTQTQVLLQSFVPAMIDHLSRMEAAGAKRFAELDAAYGAGAVIKQLTTRSSASSSVSKTTVHPVTTLSSELDEGTLQPAHPIQTDIVEVKGGTETLVQRQRTPRTLAVPATLDAGAWKAVTGPFETQTVKTDAAGPQDMVSDLQTFSHPKLENEFGHHQAMAALLPERLRHETNALSMAETAEIMASELAAMDLEIRGLQLNFVHTHLTPPVGGIITGIFKDIGESVEPGEPVVRIENDSVVFIVGRVQHQGQLWVGRSVEFRLASVFEDGSAVTIAGDIVAIRGHEADNDEWELIVRIQNPDSGGRPLLPLNYHLDPDTDGFKPL